MSTSNNPIDKEKKNEMPLFELLCIECGKTSEVLVTLSDESPTCKACGSEKLKKLLLPHLPYPDPPQAGTSGVW